MDQASGDTNVTLTTLKLDEYRVPHSNPRQQVNWITTLAPLVAIIAVLLIGSAVYQAIRKKRRPKRVAPDPNVCMDPDPTRNSDVRVRFLTDERAPGPSYR